MKKVFVGLSGGVDSSVAALLLQEAGYNVTGVYMKNWTQDMPGLECPWADDLADAKRVAVRLGINFKVYDFQQEYKDKVVQYMLREYEQGRTPNPDIMCNQEVKFKLFLETALKDGADMIAMGHYARILHKNKTGYLLQAVDKKKDQTYFLYRVTGAALSKALFPIGDYQKTQIREIARQHGLATADKKDSQGICFVGQVDMKDFLSNFIKTRKGPVVDKQTGKVIGEHDGAIFYTLGQRHGLNIGGGLPYFVVDKNLDNNTVVVTTNLNDSGLWLGEVLLKDVNWINEPPKNNIPYQARVRHLAPLVKATYLFKDGQNYVKLQEKQRAITSGQSIVIYDGERCLGGGVVA